MTDPTPTETLAQDLERLDTPTLEDYARAWAAFGDALVTAFTPVMEAVAQTLTDLFNWIAQEHPELLTGPQFRKHRKQAQLQQHRERVAARTSSGWHFAPKGTPRHR